MEDKGRKYGTLLLHIPVLLNTSIFILLSALHFYWALGGEYWYEAVLPTSSNGLNRFEPGASAGFLVAFGLMFLAAITAGNRGIFEKYIKLKYFRYGALVIALIFLVRAVGDFKFIGFFKTVKLTRFGLNDTFIFSPLCVGIALLSLLIFIAGRAKNSILKSNS